MKQTYYITLLLLLICGSGVYAQNNQTKRADRHFDRLEYVDAIAAYERLVERGRAGAYVYRQLALANRYISNPQQSERWYARVVENTTDPEDYFWYAQTLNAAGKYDQYRTQMQRFAQAKPNDARAVAFKQNPNHQEQIKAGVPKFEVRVSPLSSDKSDFGAYPHGGKVYFTSARKGSRTYGWNEEPTLDIYSGNPDGSAIEALPGDVNTRFNEGTLAITPDGNTMYFTRINFVDGRYRKSDAGISNLKIFRARWINGRWTQIEDLPINDASYSTGHPALSPDGSTLYFASDRPGGYGGTDIYKVSIATDGSLGQPQNLGATINTPADEQFPYVDSEGVLYFSSNGHLGLGGLDVFYALPQAGGYAGPVNMGLPVNSNRDDFSFTFDPLSGEGYVASNRSGGPGSDAIYNVTQIAPLACETAINVIVLDANTGNPLSGASVNLLDANGNVLENITTATDGKIGFMEVGCDTAYTLNGSRANYTPARLQTTTGSSAEQNVTLQLSPVEKEIVEDQIVLDPIFFEFDSSRVTPQGAKELDRLVGILKNQPQINIRVEAHTDSRGSAAYNQSLSQRRADATVAYVVSKGIDTSRISGQGFGQSRPKVDCGEQCNEEEHSQNRRSEFRIVE